jgi:hypothetical protein
MKFTKKGVIILAAIFILAIAGGVVWYLLEKQKTTVIEAPEDMVKENLAEETQENSKVDAVPDWVVIPDENRPGWSIYRSEKFGFEFSCPSDWVENAIKENKNYRTGFFYESEDYLDKSELTEGGWLTSEFKKGVRLVFSVSNVKGMREANFEFLIDDVRDMVKNELGGKKYEEKIIEISGQKAFFIKTNDPVDGRSFKSVDFLYNDMKFSFDIIYKNSDYNVSKNFDEIIQSFRFID